VWVVREYQNTNDEAAAEQAHEVAVGITNYFQLKHSRPRVASFVL